MSKILKCKKCGDIIQSKHRHDMVWCKCHSIAIDGGDDYFRWAGNKDDIEVYVPENEKSDLIYHLKRQLNCDYYKPCPRCNNPYGSSQFPSKDENGKDIYVCSNCNEKELFYEPLIKQLEEQNDRLIKQRDDANLKLAEKEKENEELSYKLNEKQKSDSGRGWKLENGKIIYFCNYLSNYKCERSLEDVVKDLNQMTKESDTVWEIRMLYQGLKNDNQDKISFAVEQLEKVKHYAQHIQGGLINYIDNQINRLKAGK